jgi:aminoglycoside/choline kinase family phosphotransferase
MAPDTGGLVAQILNDAWMVRNYSRNRMRREQAILKLWLTAREVFNKSTEAQDREALLTALVDGLRPHDERPF